MPTLLTPLGSSARDALDTLGVVGEAGYSTVRWFELNELSELRELREVCLSKVGLLASALVSAAIPAGDELVLGPGSFFL